MKRTDREMEALLVNVFDYQRFAQEKGLNRLITEAEKGHLKKEQRASIVPLSDSALEQVAAAGNINELEKGKEDGCITPGRDLP